MTAPAGLGPLLTDWVTRQRWFAGKGGQGGDAEILASLPLPLPGDGGDAVSAEVLAVRVGGATYQVPVTVRGAPVAELGGALIGVLGRARGRRWVYDAPHDAAFVRAYLALVAEETRVGPPGAPAGAVGRRQPGAAAPTAAGRARVLTGEQSNTSIIVEDAGAAGPVIVKLFRQLHAGANPDVVVQSALAAAGCERVPAPVGWISGTWPAGDGATACGHLAYVCEFLPDSEDAFRVACRAVDGGRSFADQARELGIATASVHATLARALPTREADAAAVRALADGLDERITWAVASASALAPHEAAARAVVEQVRHVRGLPSLQQVHGDYHLGQVLHNARRGWVLLDFEGEPLRPLAERHEPDLALRDVAGMLRSFDYAARHTTVEDDPADPRTLAAQAWAAEARTAFLAGYTAGGGADPAAHHALMRALELDKAFYEVVYETRNRPGWVGVPMQAVRRLAPVPPGMQNPTDSASNQEVPVSDRTTAKAKAKAKAPAVRPTPAVRPVDAETLARVATGSFHDPHGVLGAHPHDGGVTIRTLRPFAAAVAVVLPDGSSVPMVHEWDGIWVTALPLDQVPDYRLDVTYDGAGTARVDEPYRFLPTLGEIDLHLIREGRHEQLWDVLGAHVRRYPGGIGDVVGTSFAVWAPNARSVRIVGDFNHWVGREHGMRSLGSSGVWELFVPGVVAGARYKFEILGRDGHWRQKADPMAYGAEVPPSTASVVVEGNYTWGDQEWMAKRARTSPHAAPMAAYEVHLGSWRQGLTYLQLADQLTGYVKDMGFTHVELMPVAEHPFGGSWGYQVTSYFAPTSRFGSPDEFRHLVDRLHQAGIGVIIDWVPAHFPKDDWALARFDGEALYEYADPRKGDHPEWGTHVFDFGRTEVRNFLVANAIYWLEEFHIDGLRVDAVASMLYLDYSRKDGEWTPNIYGGREHLEAVSFLQEMNATCYKRVPGIVTIAEESTAWPGVTRPTHVGGLGFGMKWNMGWMHDSLLYMSKEPVHRQYHHHQMTFSLMYAFSENFVLPISHDEVVHGKGSLLRKMPGDRWQQLANMRAYLAFMWAHPGKQLIFMGCELGQEAEWSESRSLDWWLEETPWHAGLQQCVRDLNARYKELPAMWAIESDPAGFEWIDANDSAHNCFSFLRKAPDGSMMACLANFSGVPLEGYRIGLPKEGAWKEVLNTDSERYGGSGVGNLGAVVADATPWHGRPASAPLRVPPLGAVWLVPETED